MDDLNDKQRAFAAYYVESLCATDAARRAGYAPGSAAVTGSRLLRHAKVSLEVQRLHRRSLDRVGVRVEDVLRELQAIAFVDLRRLIDPETGGLRKLVDLDDATAAAVASVDVAVADGRTVVSRVRTWDKSRALDLLLKRLVPETVHHTHAFDQETLSGLSDADLDKVETANRLLAEVAESVPSS